MKRIISLLLGAALVLALPPAALAQQPDQQEQPKPLSPEEKAAEQKARLKMAADGLAKLYKLRPEARAAVGKAAGYAVFDISSIYAVLLVGQTGKGVLFDNGAKKTTYMLSKRAGTGPGIGAQRVYQVFVFKSKGAMEQFMLAGGTGGDVSATYSTGKDGSAYSFNPSIDIYQIPESGMAVQASWGGTVYSVDTQLQ